MVTFILPLAETNTYDQAHKFLLMRAARRSVIEKWTKYQDEDPII